MDLIDDSYATVLLTIESLNGKFRVECLNACWFMNLDDARSKLEAWHRDYNEVRPHSAIGNKTPVSLIKCSDQALPPLSSIIRKISGQVAKLGEHVKSK